MGDGGGEVLSYHRLSMHRPERYAPGPGGLDWATQPAPFRQYRGCRQVELLHRPLEESPPYDGVFSGPAAAPSRLDRRSLSQMLYDGLALSAWKEAGGTRWALRVNPSSGNLHPTEAYLLLPGGTLEPAPLLAHYRPDKHALEVRGELPATLASLLDDCLPAGGCLLALTSVPWREVWKYGERAYRYCQHDLGHALACLSIAAAIQGWEMRLLRGVAESALDGLFGLDRDGFAECESVDALFWIGPALTQEPSLSPRLCEGLAALPLAGAPNRLSREYRDWPELQRIHGLCRAPRLPARPWRVAPGEPGNDNPGLPLRPLLHRRRSAQRMDGRAGIDVGLLRAWLRRLLPERSPVPFAVTGEAARVDLLLFVHRVRAWCRGCTGWTAAACGGRRCARTSSGSTSIRSCRCTCCRKAMHARCRRISPASRTSPATAASRSPCSPISARRSKKVPGAIRGCTGNAGRSASCSTSRRRPPGCLGRVSAATTTPWCMSCLD